MDRLSNKPISLMMLSLVILGAISLIWLFTQILWQPRSLSPSESVLTDSEMVIPTIDSEEESDQAVEVEQESVTSAQTEQVESVSANTHTDESSVDTSTQTQAETVSLHLGEWRELDLEGTMLVEGLFVPDAAEGNILVGDVVTDIYSDTGESAIVAIDLTSGIIQTISQGPKNLGIGSEVRLMSAQFADGQVVWVENTLPARFSGDPSYFDLVPEFHIYDLSSATEKTTSMLTILAGGRIHYRESIIVWDGTFKDASGVYAYHVDQEKFSILQERSSEHQPVYPKVCNQEWAIYLELIPEKKHRYTLYLQHLITHEKIELDTVFPDTVSLRAQNLHQCNSQHVVWIARDSTEDALAIYNIENRQQRRVQIPDLPHIVEFQMSGDMVSTAIDPHNSIGYHLAYDVFLHVPDPWARYKSELLGARPMDFATEQYWTQVQLLTDNTSRVMVAPIERISSVAD